MCEKYEKMYMSVNILIQIGINFYKMYTTVKIILK